MKGRQVALKEQELRREKGQSVQINAADTGGRVRVDGGGCEGRRGTGFGHRSLPPTFTMALALAALRPHHIPFHTLHADYIVPLIHTSNS